MTQNQKLLLLAGAGVLAYFLWKGSKKMTSTQSADTSTDEGGGVTLAEPKSQADCPDGTLFIPSVAAEEITLTQKDGSVSKVMQEAKPAFCNERRGLDLFMSDSILHTSTGGGLKTFA